MPTLQSLIASNVVGPSLITYKVKVNASALPSTNSFVGLGIWLEPDDIIFDINVVPSSSPAWDGPNGQYGGSNPGQFAIGTGSVFTAFETLVDGLNFYGTGYFYPEAGTVWSGADTYQSGGLSGNMVYSAGSTSLPAVCSIGSLQLSIRNNGVGATTGHLTVYVYVISRTAIRNHPTVT